MDNRDKLIEQVRNGVSTRAIPIFGQMTRDGRIYSNTPPALGVMASAHLEEVDEVDKERFPYRWQADAVHLFVIISDKKRTPEEQAEPGQIYID